jgi:hypothetical protein
MLAGLLGEKVFRRFFDNFIGWEGIRWWRCCVCWLGVSLADGCGFGFPGLVLIGSGGLDLVIWIGLCWLGLLGSWIGFYDR